jgi:hypothetical protein
VGSGYLDVGLTLVSPDEDLLAYSADTTGNEVFELRFRDLRTGTDLPDSIPRSYYGGAWSADSRWFFYTVHDETYNGTTITTVDAGDLSKLTQMAGPDAALLPTGHLEISYAITDQVVVLGSGPGFVKHVLDTTKDTSLASNARYQTLASRAGAGTGTNFVDLTAIRGLVEKYAQDSKVDPAALAKYETDVKPFLAPFDALFVSATTGSAGSKSSVYLTVK